MSGGLIIVDTEYLLAEQILNNYLEALLDATSTFIRLCDWTLTQAITQSEVRVGIAGLRDDMGIAHKQLDELSQVLEGKSQAFIQHVNDIDQFIY